MSKVLMVAFHFPPAAMGSGHLRTLGFARYLPASDWEPIVLSASTAAYPHVDVANEGLIPSGCRVQRSFALDAGRQLAIHGKYPGFLAMPDRWASWWPMAVAQGMRLIRDHRIDAIWSTYPVMTAHHIAYTLSRLAKLPWIADFRDPVSSSVDAGNRFSVASQHRWEKRVVTQASKVVFTTPSAMHSYAAQFPEVFSAGRMAVIQNGYDESAFAGLPLAVPDSSDQTLRLVHSGMLYADGRDPSPFFAALANLKSAGALGENEIHIVLRASGSEAAYAKEICSLGLDRMITLAPPVSNREALREQAQADALLLFQGPRFDRQIPAKVYEYLRIGRPIFALVGPEGDTAALLRKTGGAQLVSMDVIPAIETAIVAFVRALHAGLASTVSADVARRYSRDQGAAELAELLDSAVLRT